MKNKQTAQEKIAEFLRNNPASNAKAIGEATGVKGIILVNALKKMTGEGLLAQEGKGKEATYSLVEAPEAEQPVTEELEEAGGQTEPKSKGRDNSTFQYGGAEYKKGPLVRQIISDHVAASKGKITYKLLKEAFPDELLKRFAPFMDEDSARSLSGARDRYFFKPEHLIKLKDKTIAVCNQWTADNIRPFLQAAKKLGYKIK